MVNREFWQGKRVFLTGHTGFKGSWLALWLHHLGAQVTGFSTPPPTDPALFDQARLADLLDHRVGDIRDAQALSQAMADARPDIVLHLAAQSLVRLSYRQPVETYATNVMGTVHLLEAARHQAQVQAVLCITSDKCYENHEWIWGYRETDAMGGYDPYSNSKGCSELVVSAYRHSFCNQQGMALASVRAGNVIGGGDWALDRLIPDILRAIANGQPPLIRNPHAIRPWQHVLNTLSGYLMLAERLCGPEKYRFAAGWNFGPRDEDAQTVGWITDRLCAMWGDNAHWQRDLAHHPHEATYLKLDTSKARSLLGWQPTWNLDDALAEVVTFTRAWKRGEDLRQVALRHITLFEQGLSPGVSS